jgi:hypothetical protein
MNLKTKKTALLLCFPILLTLFSFRDPEETGVSFEPDAKYIVQEENTVTSSDSQEILAIIGELYGVSVDNGGDNFFEAQSGAKAHFVAYNVKVTSYLSMWAVRWYHETELSTREQDIANILSTYVTN